MLVALLAAPTPTHTSCRGCALCGRLFIDGIFGTCCLKSDGATYRQRRKFSCAFGHVELHVLGFRQVEYSLCCDAFCKYKHWQKHRKLELVVACTEAECSLFPGHTLFV